MSACRQSRSIIAWSSGASCGVTLLTPMAARAILSEAKRCSAASPPTMRIIEQPDAPDAKSAAMSTQYTAPSRNTVMSIRA